MIWLRYWKPLAVAAILLAAFVWHKYAEHQAVTAAVASVQAKMAAAAGKQAAESLETQVRMQIQADDAVRKYEQELAKRNATVDGLAKRVRSAQLRISALSKAAADSANPSDSTTVAASDAELGRLSQAVYDACRADAEQVKALQEAWPK